MSSAFIALIWWVVPVTGLVGALLYVLWVTKFQEKFQQETQRSVGQFQRFQDSLRESQARDLITENLQPSAEKSTPQSSSTLHASNNPATVVNPPASDSTPKNI